MHDTFENSFNGAKIPFDLHSFVEKLKDSLH